jgi:hypothetical protein
MAAANEPPDGEQANMVLVTDRIYEIEGKTFTVLAFYAATHVQPNSELNWFYGNAYDRKYRVGNHATADFEMTMTIPRLKRLLTHRPDAIFEVAELEKM